MSETGKLTIGLTLAVFFAAVLSFYGPFGFSKTYILVSGGYVFASAVKRLVY